MKRLTSSLSKFFFGAKLAGHERERERTIKKKVKIKNFKINNFLNEQIRVYLLLDI